MEYLTVVYKFEGKNEEWNKKIAEAKSDFVSGIACGLMADDAIGKLDDVREVAELNHHDEILEVIE